jgi:hypothetical protein
MLRVLEFTISVAFMPLLLIFILDLLINHTTLMVIGILICFMLSTRTGH